MPDPELSFALASHHNPRSAAVGSGSPQNALLPAETCATWASEAKESTTMAKVAPYHTITPERPYGERDVYHDHNNCPTGQQIEPQNRRQGTAGRPRCVDCTRLG